METVYLVVYDYQYGGSFYIHCTLGGIYNDKKIAEKRAKELDNNIDVQRVIVKEIEINKDYKGHNRIYINEESQIFEYYT